ncbi:hypothetical protein ADUPG1_007933, partial [Aduncisulcus paluster]
MADGFTERAFDVFFPSDIDIKDPPNTSNPSIPVPSSRPRAESFSYSTQPSSDGYQKMSLIPGSMQPTLDPFDESDWKRRWTSDASEAQQKTFPPFTHSRSPSQTRSREHSLSQEVPPLSASHSTTSGGSPYHSSSTPSLYPDQGQHNPLPTLSSPSGKQTGSSRPSLTMSSSDSGFPAVQIPQGSSGSTGSQSQQQMMPRYTLSPSPSSSPFTDTPFFPSPASSAHGTFSSVGSPFHSQPTLTPSYGGSAYPSLMHRHSISGVNSDIVRGSAAMRGTSGDGNLPSITLPVPQRHSY